MIRGRGLHVVLDGRRVLDGVDFDVARGETLALVGPNGAGKTTILRCLLGLVRYAGAITVDGRDVTRDPIGTKRLLGYMPQQAAFSDDTARDALAFLAALREIADPRPRIDALLARVGLVDHARRRIRTFSVGMRQRLSLAAALIGAPPILVLDEPTASVDLHGQEEIAALLRDLQREGTTILLSSHRAEEVQALAHRLLVLDEGRVVAAGPVEEAMRLAFGGSGGPAAGTPPGPRRLKAVR